MANDFTEAFSGTLNTLMPLILAQKQQQEGTKDRELRKAALDAELKKLQSYLKGEERKSEEFDINKLISSLQLLPEGEMKQTALAELLTKTTGQDLQYKKPGNAFARLLLPKFLEKAFGIAGGIGPKATDSKVSTATPKNISNIAASRAIPKSNVLPEPRTSRSLPGELPTNIGDLLSGKASGGGIDVGYGLSQTGDYFKNLLSNLFSKLGQSTQQGTNTQRAQIINPEELKRRFG